jgi:hypothetical protein
MVTRRWQRLSLLIALWAVVGCNPCKEEIVSSSNSPDGKWTAVIVMRDCGATSAEVVSVNVHPAGDRDLHSENNAFVVKHEYATDVTWASSGSLTLRCRECRAADVIKKLDKVGPVQLVYDLPAATGAG